MSFWIGIIIGGVATLIFSSSYPELSIKINQAILPLINSGVDILKTVGMDIVRSLV